MAQKFTIESLNPRLKYFNPDGTPTSAMMVLWQKMAGAMVNSVANIDQQLAALQAAQDNIASTAEVANKATTASGGQSGTTELTGMAVNDGGRTHGPVVSLAGVLAGAFECTLTFNQTGAIQSGGDQTDQNFSRSISGKFWIVERIAGVDTDIYPNAGQNNSFTLYNAVAINQLGSFSGYSVVYMKSNGALAAFKPALVTAGNIDYRVDFEMDDGAVSGLGAKFFAHRA